MATVECLRRLDDGGGWAIAGRSPCRDINLARSTVLRSLDRQGGTQAANPYQNRFGHPVGCPAPLRRARLRVGGDQHRHDGQIVAAEVEILQVERVVVNLVNSIAVEGVGADLELDHKERAMAQQQRICALAHAGNGEFQEEMPGSILAKRVLKNRDFSETRVSLLVLKGMMMGPGELAKNCVVRYSEKLDDRGVKVCVSHGVEFQ